MDKERTSCAINRYTGGEPDQMFCARVYVQTKLWGGSWILISHSIDLVFYTYYRETKHVRRAYIKEVKRHAQTKKVAARPQEETAVEKQASTSLVEEAPEIH